MVAAVGKGVDVDVEVTSFLVEDRLKEGTTLGQMVDQIEDEVLEEG